MTRGNESDLSSGTSQYSTDDVTIDETCGFELGCGSRRIPVTKLQGFATVKGALVFVVLGALVQGFLVNGHVNAIISTIEKRFDLSSTESGLIASCYDIGACVAILSVTYIGAHGHKPLWVGWGVFLIGVSGILFSLPHFTAPMYTYTLTNNTCGASEIAECSVNSARSHRWFFYLAFIIAGFGGAPLYSLGITYMDENVGQRFSSWYIGILVTGSIIGPGIGFLVGGAFLGIYTYPEEQVSILDSNEAWVGAWWMGALIVGCIGVLSSLPILMLPRTLPGTHHHRQNRGQDMYDDALGREVAGDKDFGKRYRDFPKCVLVLLRNPVFVLVSIAGAVDSILISGLATFGAKYIETIFGLSATDAGIAFGALALVGAAGGQLLGGGLITKFNIRMTWILRMTYMAPVVTWFLSAGFIISCSDILFAGVSTQYHDTPPSGGSFVSTCNLNCGCDLNVYKPVCGADGITYYSACFAGCSAVGTAGNTYENCTCVSAATGVATNISSATTGVCSGSGCGAGGMFALFCVLMFLFMVFTFLNEASALQASLRCVAFNQRSFAIGVQWLIIRLIGTIPGPLIIGAVFDRNCAQWSLNCGEKGSCSTYNSRELSIGVFLVVLGVKVVNAVLYFAAAMTYKSSSVAVGETPESRVGARAEIDRKLSGESKISNLDDDITIQGFTRTGSNNYVYENRAFSN